MRGEDRAGALTATGIVLAGGGSRRFGRDKLVEPIAGELLVHRAIRSLYAVCEEVIVSVGAVPPPMPEDVPVVVVHDASEDEGPLAGLADALPEAETEFVVVIAGDMPDVSPAVLELMISSLEEEGDIELVALQDGDKVHPLPCVLRTSAVLSKVEAMVDTGQRRLRALLSELRVAAVPETVWRILDPSGGSLRDIDLPGDIRT